METIEFTDKIKEMLLSKDPEMQHLVFEILYGKTIYVVWAGEKRIINPGNQLFTRTSLLFNNRIATTKVYWKYILKE